MPDLSAAANAFAVVGLADVVFRAGTQLYDVLNRARAASKSIPQLLSTLKCLTAIIAEVRAFAKEFEQSPFALEDKQTLLPELETILKDFERELVDLRALATTASGGIGSGWLRQWKKSLIWALDDQKVIQSCRSLEGYKGALTAALAVTGRLDDVILRKEIKSTRADISSLQNATHSNFQNVQQQVLSSSSITLQGLQKISASIQRSAQKNNAGFEQTQASLSSNRMMLRDISAAVSSQTDVLQSRLDSLGVASQGQHTSVQKSILDAATLTNEMAQSINGKSARRHRKLSQQQAASTSSILEHMNELHSSLAQQIATLALTETDFNEIIIEGKGLENVTLPLMLIQSELVRAVGTLTREGRMEISPSEASWIQEELENLLAHCHEYAACAARERKVRHRFLAGSHEKSVSAARQTDDINRPSKFSTLSKPATVQSHYLSSNLTGRIPFHSTYKSRTAAGTLLVRTSVSYASSDSTTGETKSLDIWFSFMPRVDISTTAIFSRLRQRREAASTTPRITRFVQALNIVSNSSEVFRYTRNSDVKALQKLFAEKKASPYDYNESGESLLYHAAHSLCLETFELLLEEGADPHNCSLQQLLGREILFVIWDNLPGVYEDYTEECFTGACRMTRLAISQGCEPDSVSADYQWNLHHALPWMLLVMKGLPSRVVHDTVNFFSALGCDLEGRDSDGMTPLLSACRSPLFSQMAMMFIAKGADVNAVCSNGWNALHYILLYSNLYNHTQAQLVALLRGGCDPNALSERMDSPSMLARRYGIGRLWDSALKLAGYRLRKVSCKASENGDIMVVVSGREDDDILPNSSLSLEAYIDMRENLWKEYQSRIGPISHDEEAADKDLSDWNTDEELSGEDLDETATEDELSD